MLLSDISESCCTSVTWINQSLKQFYLILVLYYFTKVRDTCPLYFNDSLAKNKNYYFKKINDYREFILFCK